MLVTHGSGHFVVALEAEVVEVITSDEEFEPNIRQMIVRHLVKRFPGEQSE